MQVTFDKIGSVTKNAKLQEKCELTDRIESKEGVILAVEVLEDKKIYNQLEIVSGRLSQLKKGDIVAVAIGNRRALRGFVGEIPKKLKVNDTIHILNLGGVAGICTSENVKEVGHALNVKVLGAVTINGKDSINIKDFTLFNGEQNLNSQTPLIVVSGTCMNVGKTHAASEVIKILSRQKMKIAGAKLTGVAALKDTEKMKDFGAFEAVTFIDAGLTSTVQNGKEIVGIAKGAINYLGKMEPDAIVIEFGDGIYGEYGVMNILKDREIQQACMLHIGCAHDPVGAKKLAEVCEEIGLPLDIVSGPVTDNSVGCNFIVKNLHIPAYNAYSHEDDLSHYLLEKCKKFRS